MLTDLVIDNIVLIRSLSLSMDRGLTCLTGETGAGKSILLDSLGLALGARADSGLLSKGTDGGQVSASFDLPADHTAFQILKDNNFIVENSTLILRRTLGADGRSKAFINDKPISLNLFRQVGDVLVDIHGQFETAGLLDNKNHLPLLDRFGGLQNDCKEVSFLWRAWRDAIKALDDHRQALEQAREDEEYLIACVEELSALSPEKGEEDILLDKRQKLQNYETIMAGLNESFGFLEGDKAANDQCYRALRALEKIADKAGEEADALITRLDKCLSDLRDVAGDIELFGHRQGEDDNLEHVDDRLHALRGAARKHNILCDDLPDLLDTMQDKLNAIAHDDKALAGLEIEVQKAEDNFMVAAKMLSKKRMQAANQLAQAVMGELPDLKLENAVFRVALDVLETPNENGLERVWFALQTNPGSPEGDIGKVASGGELSRIMLALKVVLTKGQKTMPTLVFDEVDSGVGGATADAVGQRLARLADNAQVLVVTHSPQVAARAQNHWIVSKAVLDDGNRTETTVTPIAQEQDRIDEIARMVSGASLTDEARAAAKALRQAA